MTGNSVAWWFLKTCIAECLQVKKNRKQLFHTLLSPTFPVKFITLWEKRGWTRSSQSCSPFLECKHSTTWPQNLYKYSFLHASARHNNQRNLTAIPVQVFISTLQPGLIITAQPDRRTYTGIHFCMLSTKPNKYSTTWPQYLYMYSFPHTSTRRNQAVPVQYRCSHPQAGTRPQKQSTTWLQYLYRYSFLHA